MLLRRRLPQFSGEDIHETKCYSPLWGCTLFILACCMNMRQRCPVPASCAAQQARRAGYLQLFLMHKALIVCVLTYVIT